MKSTRCLKKRTPFTKRNPHVSMFLIHAIDLHDWRARRRGQRQNSHVQVILPRSQRLPSPTNIRGIVVNAHYTPPHTIWYRRFVLYITTLLLDEKQWAFERQSKKVKFMSFSSYLGCFGYFSLDFTKQTSIVMRPFSHKFLIEWHLSRMFIYFDILENNIVSIEIILVRRVCEKIDANQIIQV